MSCLARHQVAQGDAVLSQRTRYAIRALLHLGDRHGQGPIQLAEIAERQNIPAKFLTVILSEMKRAGFVETMRGKEGGYWLARPPSEITYGDIVRATRGSLALVPCAARLAYAPCDHCIEETQCRMRHVMLSVRDETARILDRVSLAEPLSLPPLEHPSTAEQAAEIRDFRDSPATPSDKVGG